MRTVCCDRDMDNVFIFTCPTSGCVDHQCVDCLWKALSDGTRGDGRKCPACNTTKRAVCQIIASKAVADQHQLLARHSQCTALKEVTAEARKVYSKVAKDILLKCQHCKLERGIFDGNKILACQCGAGFCGICFIDCADIHQHVTHHHGARLENDLIRESGSTRIKGIVHSHLRRVAKTSDELTQRINNHLQNAGHLHDRIAAGTSSRLTRQFLVNAKGDLDSAVLNDRLSILSQPGRVQWPLKMSMICPRNSIPSEYRLTLTVKRKEGASLSLYKKSLVGIWLKIPLEGTKDEPVVDSLVNLKATLLCAVIAIEGERCLYQTRCGDALRFHRVDGNGHVGEACSLSGDYNVLALNSNKRLLLLQRHVKLSSDEKLMINPIGHLIGAGNPKALLDEITFPVPDTVFELNKQQSCVAHPLHVKTAMEVAGPPGTGKTKTITELTRSLLECTDYNIIVFSERNGAIDAIAEKIFQTTMTCTGTIESKRKHIEVQDLQLWSQVLTFGSKAMGHNTKLFSLPTKLE